MPSASRHLLLLIGASVFITALLITAPAYGFGDIATLIALAVAVACVGLIALFMHIIALMRRSDSRQDARITHEEIL